MRNYCQMLDLHLCADVSMTNRVRNHSTECQIDLFICTGTSHDLPEFRKICNIVTYEQQAVTRGCPVKTLYFDKHFRRAK